MAKYYKNTAGNCPYCAFTTYTETEVRREKQTLMKCQSCNKWSVRSNSNQYPLSNPLDKTSLPGTVSGD